MVVVKPNYKCLYLPNWLGKLSVDVSTQNWCEGLFFQDLLSGELNKNHR